MAGNNKDIVITKLPSTIILSASYDYVDFAPGWVIMLEEATDKRFAYSWARTEIQKVVVSPKGVAYPGDAAPGTGPYKITVDFLGSPATVIMTRCDNLDVVQGWALITKGDHLIAYSPSIIYTLTQEPV